MDTAAQILAKVRTRLEDPNSVFFSDADLVLAYNDALDELSEATEINEYWMYVKRKKWAAYVDLRAYLPPDALRVTAVFNPSTGMWMDPVTVRELDETVGRKWEASTGSSRWWWMQGLYHLGAYPVPTDDTSPLKIYYSALIPHIEENGGLATGTGVRAPLPPDYGDAIEHYMMYQLLSQKHESKKSLTFWQRYQEIEAELKDDANNRMRRDKTPIMGLRRRSSGMGARR